MVLKALDVADLWEDYQNKLEKGIDEAYIKTGDHVLLQTKEYMDRQGIPLTNPSRKYCALVLPVVQSCKVATDLWYTTIKAPNGEDVIVYDDEIALVFREESEV